MRRVVLLWAILSSAAGLPSALAAQRSAPDTTHRTTISVTRAADSVRAPLSGRRALVYSFLVPGSAQTILGRHKAAATFAFVEAVTIAMIRESAADVHEARRMANDSTVLSYDPSGVPTYAPTHFSSAYVRTRESHVEDWTALLVANHLFAGADAFVAANLWDVPAHLAFRVLPGAAMLSASFTW